MLQGQVLSLIQRKGFSIAVDTAATVALLLAPVVLLMSLQMPLASSVSPTVAARS